MVTFINSGQYWHLLLGSRLELISLSKHSETHKDIRNLVSQFRDYLDYLLFGPFIFQRKSEMKAVPLLSNEIKSDGELCPGSCHFSFWWNSYMPAHPLLPVLMAVLAVANSAQLLSQRRYQLSGTETPWELNDHSFRQRSKVGAIWQQVKESKEQVIPLWYHTHTPTLDRTYLLGRDGRRKPPSILMGDSRDCFWSERMRTSVSLLLIGPAEAPP